MAIHGPNPAIDSAMEPDCPGMRKCLHREAGGEGCKGFTLFKAL